MYSDLNSIFRDKIDATTITYRSEQVPIIYSTDYDEGDGSNCIVSTLKNQPDSTEIGFNAARIMTGFIQFIAKLPNTKKGLDYALSNISQEIESQYPRSNFVDGDFKVEWLEVEEVSKLRIDGFSTVTVRVHYQVFAC